MNDANKKLLKDCFQAVADAHTPSVGTHAAFFADILKERQRQLQLHPTSEDLPDDGQSNSGARLTYREQSKNACERAFRQGKGTFSYIFEEEIAEALYEASIGDVDKLEIELVQVAAVCAKWVAAIQRRKEKQIDPNRCPTPECGSSKTSAWIALDSGAPNSANRVCDACGRLFQV